MLEWIEANSTNIIIAAFFIAMLFKGKIMAKIYGIDNVSAAQLKKMDNPAILDVRTPAEFSSSHIPGAKNIPLHQLTKESYESWSGSSTNEVYIICASGNRSMNAAINIKKWGHSNIKNVYGGMFSYGTSR